MNEQFVSKAQEEAGQARWESCAEVISDLVDQVNRSEKIMKGPECWMRGLI